MPAAWCTCVSLCYLALMLVADTCCCVNEQVSDLMKELNVHGVSAEASHTNDPYDPWEPKSGPSMKAVPQKAPAATALRERASEEVRKPSKYETATRVFKAASAAYQAAAQTWRELEAKEQEAQVEQAKLDKSVARTGPQEPGPHAVAHLSPGSGGKQGVVPESRALPPTPRGQQAKAPSKRSGSEAVGGGKSGRSREGGERGERGAAHKGETKGARMKGDLPAPPTEAAPAAEPSTKKGLPRYKAGDAQHDLNSFFDTLIARRVAVVSVSVRGLGVWQSLQETPAYFSWVSCRWHSCSYSDIGVP